MRKLKSEITKPYRISLVVDNKPLVENRSTNHSCQVQRLDRPLYDGEQKYNHNPFWVTLLGGTEFELMKLVRREFSPAQVIEIKKV